MLGDRHQEDAMTAETPRALSRRHLLQIAGGELSVTRRSTSVPFPDFARGGWSKERA
jgi:hypothetical protein